MTENELNDSVKWKHATRNIVSWNEGALIFFFVQMLGIWAVHIFGASHTCQVFFFWILGPVLTIGIFAWLACAHGPVLDLVGYIVVSVILYLATILKQLFYSEEEKSSN